MIVSTARKKRRRVYAEEPGIDDNDIMLLAFHFEMTNDACGPCRFSKRRVYFYTACWRGQGTNGQSLRMLVHPYLMLYSGHPILPVPSPGLV